MSGQDSLYHLGVWLRESGYRFITVTPATHARVIARSAGRLANSFEDVFGWNMPFQPQLLPPSALAMLDAAQALEHNAGALRSLVRFSSLGDALYVHSAYPTADENAVFFGPDTYRFASLIRRTLAARPQARINCIADIGCGSGAGGITAAQLLNQQSPALILADINPAALHFAQINAALAAMPRVNLLQSDLFQNILEPVDLIVANPPYLLDADARIYRHGGGKLGSGLSTRIVLEGLPRLAVGGTLILYTGVPVVDGCDVFRQALEPALNSAGVDYEYAEIDPDVFGEELENPAYAQVDRIAAVSLVIDKTGDAERAILMQISAAEPAVDILLPTMQAP